MSGDRVGACRRRTGAGASRQGLAADKSPVTVPTAAPGPASLRAPRRPSPLTPYKESDDRLQHDLRGRSTTDPDEVILGVEAHKDIHVAAVISAVGALLACQRSRPTRPAGLTQTEPARRADIDRSYYAEVETGLHSVSIDRIFAIADALNVSPRELIHRDLSPRASQDQVRMATGVAQGDGRAG
ncbi:helix-turn-helix domain-containing protein [Actinomadura sp. 1N219]|uniref:helix-turn-helix domain-containing protein n=1 Tax=Actinomadura sp. 1N219 TaxID=3375152 RepID=UPI0037A6F9BA